MSPPHYLCIELINHPMVTTNPTYPNTLYLSAPLPFVGQKRMFAKHFIEVIKQYPSGTVFVDLFGGSGLLSHITKHFHPESRVIYNDFDNYRHRIGNIDRTNRLLSLIRPIASQFPGTNPSPARQGSASSICLSRRNGSRVTSTSSRSPPR